MSNFFRNWMLPFRQPKPLELADMGALIIDMQPYFLDKIEHGKRSRLLEAQIESVECLVEANIPTIVLEYDNEGETHESIKGKCGELKVCKYIAKHYDDGFRETDLKDILDHWNLSKLIVMGINASFCVKETVRNAVDNGYQVFTARQLIANGRSEQKLLD